MNEFLTGANSKELLDINLAYGILAIKDLSHFYAYGNGIERASEDDRPRADPPPSTPLGSKQWSSIN